VYLINKKILNRKCRVIGTKKLKKSEINLNLIIIQLSQSNCSFK